MGAFAVHRDQKWIISPRADMLSLCRHSAALSRSNDGPQVGF